MLDDGALNDRQADPGACESSFRVKALKRLEQTVGGSLRVESGAVVTHEESEPVGALQLAELYFGGRLALTVLQRMFPLPKCEYPRKPLIWFTFCGKAVLS